MSDGAPVAGDAVEVEWQFDAPDLRPVERWLAALPERAAEAAALPVLTVRAKPPRRLVDRYFDTEDWRMAGAGFVLRVRRRGQHQEATIKDAGTTTEGGLRRRLEVTEDLPVEGLEALGDGGPVGRRVAAVAGAKPLRPVLEIRTRRQPFSLRNGTEEVAEVALDQTTFVVGAGRPPAQLRRVEVEVPPEWADALEPLVDELRRSAGLTPASRSKFESGLAAAGLTVPGPPELGPTAAGRGATLGELAYATLRTYLAVLLAREPGTRLGDDPEELHDMRVATRRLRAVLDLFSDALPPNAGALRQELGWVAAALGSVRDLDVQLSRTPALATGGIVPEAADRAVEDLRGLLGARRAEARRALLGALDSARWERAKADLVALARRGPDHRSAHASLPAVSVVGPLVLERHRRAVVAARRARGSGDPKDHHRLRIRCKKLRYSLELTTALYGGPARRYTRRLAKLQDALGLLQDDEVARARLAALATASAEDVPALSAGTVFAMGALSERYRQDAAARIESLRPRLGKLTGRSWDRLSATIERRARAAGAGAPGERDRLALPGELGRLALPGERAPGDGAAPDVATAPPDEHRRGDGTAPTVDGHARAEDPDGRPPTAPRRSPPAQETDRADGA